MANLKCRWCSHEFEQEIIGGTVSKGRTQVKCTKCFRTLPSSIKVIQEDGKHIHIDYK